MKPTIQLMFVIVALLMANLGFSQACAISIDTAHLDVNNARVILQASGDFWWDRQTYQSGYLIPKPTNTEPGIPAFRSGGFWLAGNDSGGNLKVAAQMYGAAVGNSDWWPGPLDPAGGFTNIDNCTNYDRLWKINRSEVESHIADFVADGDIDGPVPANILKWPGKKNPESLSANGFNLPNQSLAPFIDINGNGIYEPNAGDFPKFLGDQAVWWVFNDEGGGNIHGETNGFPVRAEVQAMAFAYEGENDEDLANTTFYDFTIINRAPEFIDSMYTALWLESDLGCAMDDYFGCISSEKMAFVYNMDALDGDENCECPGVPLTYCDNIPITAIKVLGGPKNEAGEDVSFSSFTYFNNPSFQNPIPAMTDPANDIEFNRYMTGSWRDGTPFTSGGNGYSPTGGTPYPFAFDGNPGDTQSWSMCSENIPDVDQRILISSGPVKLQPNESTIVRYAVMTKFGFQYPCPDITPLIEMGNGFESLTGTSEKPHSSQFIQFYPNPLLSEGKLTSNGEPMESVRLFNANGQLVRLYNDLKTNELTIERGVLPTGLYYYAALLVNGQLATGKIAIQ
jgi:hypothetical protein